MKFGQFPSIADISFNEMSRFRKIINATQMGELKRAIGLSAHGIGIGSFVYLRRVFESILEDHRKSTEEAGDLINDWDTMRVSDKIEALKASLPDFLVKNKSVYGILSKGIHELDEDSCLKYFPILREAIYTIMEEDERRRVIEEKRESLEKMISAISGKSQPGS